MTVAAVDFSPVAVTFQAIGTLLLALILGQIARTFGWRYVRQWAWAWAAMFIAIMAVRVYIATLRPWPWWLVYLVAQWMFLVLLFAGCRDLVDDPFPLRLLGYATPLALTVAILIVVAAPDFGALFMIEAAIVAIVVATCFVVVGRVTQRTVGWHMMRLSLALLGVLYAAYVPLYAMARRGVIVPYLDASSLADLLAAVLLGYSMVLIAAEGAHRELTDAVTALQAARDQLAIKANTDPLTAALSRHAFHAMPREMSGAVIMVDVDRLKRINDAEGHAAGDEAIRTVANAIRTRVRADDLLFRWGGDEFLVVMPQLPLELVMQRFESLDGGITTPRGTMLTVSWGAAAFLSAGQLDEAIRAADRAMYARKAAARAD
ncbi:MAG: GGDEF domain-containing protein [Acidobacteriota bacterium]|nr:GGDEF domain-containing protein [Acidobacteriota bacterium]